MRAIEYERLVKLLTNRGLEVPTQQEAERKFKDAAKLMDKVGNKPAEDVLTEDELMRAKYFIYEDYVTDEDNYEGIYSSEIKSD